MRLGRAFIIAAGAAGVVASAAHCSSFDGETPQEPPAEAGSDAIDAPSPSQDGGADAPPADTGTKSFCETEYAKDAGHLLCADFEGPDGLLTLWREGVRGQKWQQKLTDSGVILLDDTNGNPGAALAVRSGPETVPSGATDGPSLFYNLPARNSIRIAFDLKAVTLPPAAKLGLVMALHFLASNQRIFFNLYGPDQIFLYRLDDDDAGIAQQDDILLETGFKTFVEWQRVVLDVVPITTGQRLTLTIGGDKVGEVTVPTSQRFRLDQAPRLTIGLSAYNAPSELRIDNVTYGAP